MDAHFDLIVWYDNGGKNHGAYRPFSPTTATSTMFDPEAMFIASIMAGMDQSKVNCRNGSIPFMEMEPYPIIVNNAGDTVNDTNTNNIVPNVYESVAWLPNMDNGTWNLGTFQVDSFLAYQPSKYY